MRWFGALPRRAGLSGIILGDFGIKKSTSQGEVNIGA